MPAFRLAMGPLLLLLSLLSLLFLLAACSSEQNDPYPEAERGENILYAAFTDRPKHLDPVQSYSEDEITFTAPNQINPDVENWVIVWQDKRSGKWDI